MVNVQRAAIELWIQKEVIVTLKRTFFATRQRKKSLQQTAFWQEVKVVCISFTMCCTSCRRLVPDHPTGTAFLTCTILVSSRKNSA